MSTATQFFGDRIWTSANIDEAIGEDENWRRYEIVDGVLIVTPHPAPRHELVVSRLIRALGPVVAAEDEVLGSVAIELGRSYRITDVTVVNGRIFEPGHGIVGPSDVLLAIEVESPSSVTTDRITKPAQYALGRIPHYWRVELDPLRLHTYRLAGDGYESAGSWEADETAQIVDPFNMRFELSSLLR